MKKKEHTLKMRFRRRIIQTFALLMVSLIMLVSTSYAWLVLSTAPEVTGVQTTVGANGSLEIALMNAESWEDLSLLDRGDIDESAALSALDANLTWGNLINLADSSYGLNRIVLNPSRLYLEEDGSGEGNTNYKINTTLLKIPVYGEDGRINSLDKTSAVALVCNNGQFDTEGYGVRAIGTAASMSPFQLGMNAARSALVTYTSAARTLASNALNQSGDAMAEIVVQYALNGQTEGYTTDDIQAARTMAAGLKDALTQIENALREVYAGYITTQTADVDLEDYTDARAAINDPATTLAELNTLYPGVSALIPDIGTYISTLAANQVKVNTAIADCDTKIAAGGPYTWTEVASILTPIMDTDRMTMGGQSIGDLKDSVKNPDGSINFGAVFDLIQGGIVISVPTGSGLLSDIADFAGNYTCKVTVRDFTYGTYGPMDLTANMRTETAANPVYLTVCGNALKNTTVSDASGNNTITDFYGYALDLSFRTNAVNSNLILQTEPENRIYQGDNQNAQLQGSGSYMSFTNGSGLSATKMVKLMGGIRVVFMDDTQSVLGVAALDCTLGKGDYTELSNDDKAATGKYAYMNGGAGSYQQSDLISYDDYDALPETGNVVFDGVTGSVTAKLYMYGFSMTKNAGGNNTGGMTLEGKRDDAVITALLQDTVKRVTSLVYLDGSVVNNSMVAADSAQSMTGTLNLQFASDATLIPAENTLLHIGE